MKDLRNCSIRGIDKVIEKPSELNNNTNQSTLGQVERVSNGVVFLKRSSDGAERRYSVQDLSEIWIGMCQ